MTKEQQELYEKLLKKVNEYCLGYAAEDVIAAIDALVDTYETRIAADDYFLRDIKYYIEGKTFTAENLLKSLRALEIIKSKKVNVRAFLKSCSYKDIDTQLNVYNSQCCDWQERESKELTREEYELLKEILK